MEKRGEGALHSSSFPTSALPPSFVVDEIARDEWRRVHSALFGDAELSMAQCSLLAGYCNAVARAVRAEQILAKEGAIIRRGPVAVRSCAAVIRLPTTQNTVGRQRATSLSNSASREVP
ncbi:MAG: P27 family phage terminase small subunit [Defluviicoccus sp.]|nr:MAG: P27 family phage terminase small subunit [Defluviicoccus sp.]